ncbi:MAG: sigma-70 family RNA polymerase sigma factor [Saprospiraceae bacterium]|nr:sigma-70 family RNA polymerase sigma factor [Saprospiraceae bacterium]
MTTTERKHISTVVKEYGQRLFRFIRGRVNSDEDAEDILQDVWFQLSNLGNLDELESAGAWLYQVARNRVTDLYRKRKTDSLDGMFLADDPDIAPVRDLLLQDDLDPEVQFFQEMFWEELFAALEELPENQRSVFILNELEGKTLQEIADASGEKLKTVISRKGYAVSHLRKKLFNLYEELNF